MTHKELAAFNRLDKRRDRLFKALCIIHTWLSFPDEGHTLYRIAKLVTEYIEDERAAQVKEDGKGTKVAPVHSTTYDGGE